MHYPWIPCKILVENAFIARSLLPKHSSQRSCKQYSADKTPDFLIYLQALLRNALKANILQDPCKDCLSSQPESVSKNGEGSFWSQRITQRLHKRNNHKSGEISQGWFGNF